MHFKEDQAQSEKRIVLSSDYTLPFTSNFANYPLRYGVVFTIDNDGLTTEIKYELEISEFKAARQGVRCFTIHRISEVYINGVTPDLLAEQLAYEAGKAFYPLNIETNEQIAFLRVANYQDIKKRWILIKDHLFEYFTGEPAVKYIHLMDAAIVNEGKVNEAIASDPFINVYFSGIYRSYSPGLTVQGNLTFPLIGMSLTAAYHAGQQLNPVLNDFGAIEIVHKGYLADSRSVADFEQGYQLALSRIEQQDIPSAKGEYSGMFILNAQTYLVETAIVHWTLHLTKTKSFNLKLFEMIDSVRNRQDIPLAHKQQVGLNNVPKDEKRDTGIFSKFMESLFGK